MGSFFLNYFLPIVEVRARNKKKDEEQLKLLPTLTNNLANKQISTYRKKRYIGDQWKQFSILVIEMFDAKISIISIPARALANRK